MHSINTERLHRRAGKPRLSRHSEWEILQNGSEALFYISFLSPPSRSVPFSSLPNLPSLSGEKRSRFRTMRKRWRCTCERIDVSPSSMTTAAAVAAVATTPTSSTGNSNSPDRSRIGMPQTSYANLTSTKDRSAYASISKRNVDRNSAFTPGSILIAVSKYLFSLHVQRRVIAPV